jgi:hypothetical protein
MLKALIKKLSVDRQSNLTGLPQAARIANLKGLKNDAL